MKLTQLSTCEFKLDSFTDFCLNSNGNCMVLIGNSNDISTFELIDKCDTMVLMPYSNKIIAVSQNKPVSEVIKEIDLVHIYKTGTAQESQELALDIIYTADCAVEHLKARVLQANIINKDGVNICCILTTYGYCEIFQKNTVSGEWRPLQTNLSNILISEVFSSNELPSNIKNYNNLKNFADKFIITCFNMFLRNGDLIILIGTAAGYIVALKYNETSRKFGKYCHLKTSMNRLSYIAVHKNLILASCDQGKVLLVKINFENIGLQELEYLWSKSDRMSCRQAIFTYSEDLRSHLLIFCKAAHVLSYRLNLDGAVVSNSTLYVNGIKITGIESLSENEFILTTITCAVKYIKISCPTNEELYIEAQEIEHEFDSANYQILGLATSPSKNIWSFVLFRNKDYVHQSKHSPSSAFINVCKLSSKNSFVELINLNLKNMNMALDLVLAINLDIFNNMETDKYINFLKLENLSFPDEIHDAFLQKLQIKIIITRKLAKYQNIKYRKLKSQTKNELELLEPMLQMVHILLRLRNLKRQYSKEVKLSNFQELSITCMQLQFSHSLNGMTINNNDPENTLHKAVDEFVNFFKSQFKKYKFDISSFTKQTEYCMICDEVINNFLKCDQEHEIKRCIISFTQLTLFKTKYCPHCYALARNDDDAKLQELFATDECITCIYCRFLLKQEEF